MDKLKMYSSVKATADGKFVVTIDTDAFMEEVQKYLDLSPVMAEWNEVKKLKWPDALIPPAFWTTMKDVQLLISLVCSAVEIAKQNVVKAQDPDGTKGLKFDKEVALNIAVTLVSKLIKFNGIIGSVVNKLWLPLLNVVISIYVTGQQADWVSIAMGILKIVLV